MADKPVGFGYRRLNDGRYRLEQVVALPDLSGWHARVTFVTDASGTDAYPVRVVIEHEAGDLAPPLPARALRALSFVQIRRLAYNEFFAAELRASESGTYDPIRQKLLQALVPKRVKATGRPRRWSDHELALLAQRYLEFAGDGVGREVQRLAAEVEIPASTVRGMLDAARKRGLLESEMRGKAGGALTATGRRALRDRKAKK
jgi:hypothetical protein